MCAIKPAYRVGRAAFGSGSALYIIKKRKSELEHDLAWLSDLLSKPELGSFRCHVGFGAFQIPAAARGAGDDAETVDCFGLLQWFGLQYI